jgi:hypothetical protein
MPVYIVFLVAITPILTTIVTLAAHSASTPLSSR